MFKKHKNDPEVTIPQSKEMIENHLKNFEALRQAQQEKRMRAIEEEPRLEEFENYLRQHINDYIASIQPHTIELPLATYVYCCYTNIKQIITRNDYPGDKDFKNWFIKKDIGYIREIISHEIGIYIQLCHH